LLCVFFLSCPPLLLLLLLSPFPLPHPLILSSSIKHSSLSFIQVRVCLMPPCVIFQSVSCLCVSEDKDPCQLPEAPGPCRGLVSRFLFDPETQSCRHFFYGGCFGNANNFRTIDECKNKCQSTGTGPGPGNANRALADTYADLDTRVPISCRADVDVSEDCLLAVDRGSCDEPQRRYFYNSTSGRCQIFKFSGCGGNANNFLHRRHCIKKCVHRAKGQRSICRNLLFFQINFFS
uniref:BPTI/Kunitz inhibitor domain-containing protein n=1 Tax=Periophthalmus magnuspinnatus TaxID=409849 RepID=A0A3B4AJT1_9GOBI